MNVGKDYFWKIGLKRFGKVDPLCKNSPVFIENWPEFTDDDSICRIDSVKAFGQVRFML